MHEVNGDNGDMTGLDRVRRQIDRALNRIDPLEVEGEEQVEMMSIFKRIGFELNNRIRYNSPEEKLEVDSPSLADMAEILDFDHLKNDERMNDHLSIVDRLVEIKHLLDKQENAYQEKKRARELRNRAIAEYAVLACMWALGAITTLIFLRV